jgi:hypothetical protein
MRAPRRAVEFATMLKVKVALAQISSAFRRAAKPNPMKSTMTINWAREKRK